MSPMGFEPMPVSRRQLECRVLDRSTTVTIEMKRFSKLFVVVIIIIDHLRISKLKQLINYKIKFITSKLY